MGINAIGDLREDGRSPRPTENNAVSRWRSRSIRYPRSLLAYRARARVADRLSGSACRRRHRACRDSQAKDALSEPLHLPSIRCGTQIRHRSRRALSVELLRLHWHLLARRQLVAAGVGELRRLDALRLAHDRAEL